MVGSGFRASRFRVWSFSQGMERSMLALSGYGVQNRYLCLQTGLVRNGSGVANLQDVPHENADPI